MKRTARALANLPRSEQIATRCQLCNREPSVACVASFRVGARCGANLAAIAADAGVRFRLGHDEVDAPPYVPDL